MILCQNLGIYAASTVLKIELENFNIGLLRPNQDVLTQEEFVPWGVQLTQKLEPFWNSDQRLLG